MPGGSVLLLSPFVLSSGDRALLSAHPILTPVVFASKSTSQLLSVSKSGLKGVVGLALRAVSSAVSSEEGVRAYCIS